MKLHQLRIDAFGGWRGLELGPFAPGLTVVHGPNEAGKTTVMHFVRAMLYGFSPEKRSIYWPPVGGGPAGGRLTLDVPAGRVHLDRQEAQPKSGDPLGKVRLISTDGIDQPPERLADWLAGVDEASYANVFALELREMQELSALNAAQASRELYRLSVGLDTPSLYEVEQELLRSRRRVVSTSGVPSLTAELQARKETVLARIAAAGGARAKCAEQAAERERLATTIGANERKANELERDLRKLDVAGTVQSLWKQRDEIRELAEALGKVAEPRADALTKLQEIDAALAAAKSKASKAAERRKTLHAEFTKLEVNKPLIALGSRLGTLERQQKWLLALAPRAAKVQSEITQIEKDIAEYRSKLGLSANAPAPKLADAAQSQLAPLAHAAELARKRFRQIRKKSGSLLDESDAVEKEIALALEGRTEHDFDAAVQEATHLVAQLKKRKAIERKIRDAEIAHGDSVQTTSDEIVAQPLPWQLTSGLSAMFVTGLATLVLSFIMPSLFPRSIGWALTLGGPMLMALATAGNYIWNQMAENRLERARGDNETVSAQLAQLQEDARKIDVSLPESNLSLDDRLAEAEAELKRFEELAPLRRKTAATREKAGSAKQQIEAAKNELRRAVKRWRAASTQHQLPAKLMPTEFSGFARSIDRLGELQLRLASRREDAEHHKDLQEALLEQIREAFVDAGLASPKDVAAGMKKLQDELASHVARRKRREDIKHEADEHDKTRRKALREAAKLEKRRSAWLLKCKAKSGEDLKAKVDAWLEARQIDDERVKIQKQIDAALGDAFTTDEIAATLAGDANAKLPLGQRRKTVADSLAAVRKELQTAFERRGVLNSELGRLGDDRALDDLRIELATLDAQIAAAEEDYLTSAVVSKLFDDVRKDMEKARQPATLRLASQHMERLSEGRYTRIWSPLGEAGLSVDDAHGRTLPVEKLSRGTREQLFLSLRLALVGWYAEQGVRLPLVFDDLLVNFDDRRAAAAAQVLCEMGSAGSQILVFTCHEHILRTFERFGAASRTLPERDGVAPLRRAPLALAVPAPVVPPVAPLPTAPLAVSNLAVVSVEPVVDVQADTQLAFDLSDPASRPPQRTPAILEPLSPARAATPSLIKPTDSAYLPLLSDAPPAVASVSLDPATDLEISGPFADPANTISPGDSRVEVGLDFHPDPPTALTSGAAGEVVRINGEGSQADDAIWEDAIKPRVDSEDEKNTASAVHILDAQFAERETAYKAQPAPTPRAVDWEKFAARIAAAEAAAKSLPEDSSVDDPPWGRDPMILPNVGSSMERTPELEF
ncbi:MAG TPA: AAA family ATPase, partial [Pirellulales bacterium]